VAYKQLREGATAVRVPDVSKVSKEMEVFYNPVMKLNRDVTVLLLQVLGTARKRREGSAFPGFSIGSPLAGTGVRECRLLVELEKGLVKSVNINDYSEDAVKLINENLALNKKKMTSKAIAVSREDASLFLLNSKGFDHIDIDPFGTPNPFLDAACKRISREGVLAVTATDTSALAGTYPDACARKYWATPMRNHLMHEVGVRILIRKVQLVGAQYDKALLPIFSYSKDHYMRVFFLCTKGKKDVDEIIKQHRFVEYDSQDMSLTISSNEDECKSGNENNNIEHKRTNKKNKEEINDGEKILSGPLWVGQLWDATLAKEMAKTNGTWKHGQSENQKFLDTLAREAGSPVLGFYQLNLVLQTTKRQPLRKEELLKRKRVWPTHFDANAVKATKVDLLF
jgi:tRNA (guanine26-N2/guanine27-N2)-dimethyltransferase